ncbi:hypothetical protein D3C76_1093370 [compost metagenome]
MKKTISLAFGAMAMSGCTTYEMVSGGAHSVANGDIGQGSVLIVAGLIGGPVVDTVDLLVPDEAVHDYSKQSATSTAPSTSQTSNNTPAPTSTYSAISSKEMATQNQSKLVDGTDGFEFRTFTSDNGMPQYDAKGGPCTSVGIVGMKGSLGDAIRSLAADHRSTYDIRTYTYLRGTNQEANYLISHRVDWSAAVRHRQDEYDYNLQNGASHDSIEGAKSRKDQTECLARSHIQYVIALENWSEANKTEITKLWTNYMKNHQ